MVLVIKTLAKLDELGFKLLPHSPFSPDLALRYYWLTADLKKILKRKRFDSSIEFVTVTEAYLKATDKSFYRHGIKKLEMFDSLTKLVFL